MKRLALSVLGGFAIPLLYGVIVGPLTAHIQNDALKELAGYPVRWPIIILGRVLPLDSFPFRDGNESFLFLLIIVCDVLLYSVLTYILLLRFWKRKGEQPNLPPNPPSFVQR